MNPALPLVCCSILLAMAFSPCVHADQLLMQNGDRYTGKVLSMSAETVQLQNEVLGKINLPRAKVASMSFGTNAIVSATPTNAASAEAPANLPKIAGVGTLTNANTKLPATASNLSANADLARQIREQLLAGSPEAAGKYNELIEGFMNGKLDVNDIRREAKSSAEQLRKLKSELGPKAGDALDGYLKVLDSFLNETEISTNATNALKPKAPGH